MSDQQTAPVQKNAAERIQDLEISLANAYQTLDRVTKENLSIREIIKLLNNKIDAMGKAVNNGEKISDEVLDNYMDEMAVQELKNKVDNMVTQGVLIPSNEITANSFIAVREINKEGKVTQKRLQLPLFNMDEKTQALFIGKKIDEKISTNQDGANIEILEVYEIVANPASAPAETAPSANEAPSAPEAPAAESVPTEAAPVAAQEVPASAEAVPADSSLQAQ